MNGRSLTYDRRMRALILVAVVVVVGCKASSDKAARETTAGGGAAQPQATSPPPPPAPDPVTAAPGGGGSADAVEEKQDKPKTDSRGFGGAVPNEGRSKGSGTEAARNAGMLGPADRRAFPPDGTVSIKSFTSKDLDATVKTKLDALQACYTKALEFQEALVGELTIAVKDGKATVAKSTLGHAELEQCVVEALAGVTLPKAKASLVLAFKRG